MRPISRQTRHQVVLIQTRRWYFSFRSIQDDFFIFSIPNWLKLRDTILLILVNFEFQRRCASKLGNWRLCRTQIKLNTSLAWHGDTKRYFRLEKIIFRRLNCSAYNWRQAQTPPYNPRHIDFTYAQCETMPFGFLMGGNEENRGSTEGKKCQKSQPLRKNRKSFEFNWFHT